MTTHSSSMRYRAKIGDVKASGPKFGLGLEHLASFNIADKNNERFSCRRGIARRFVSVDVTVICGHITISMFWGNATYRVKLSCEDLSRYSTKIESVGY